MEPLKPPAFACFSSNHTPQGGVSALFPDIGRSWPDAAVT
ncbi:hypothetical protein MMMDOFMJ_0253 [Methylobacterium gnaphalii]|nr:hypothetical protein MMMDOFMJ_0253 [Methylobacterium gnaphalii]